MQKDCTISDSVDDIAALINALRLDRYILIGHSMGGKIALAFAARQPRGLASLALLAPSPPSPEPIPDAERARLVLTYGSRAAALETIRKVTARTLPAAMLEQAVADNLRSSSPAWKAWLEHGSLEDFSNEAAKVKTPVMVVAGECDEAITKELLEREVVWHIETSYLKVIPHGGHLLPLEAPAEVAQLIRDVALNRAAK